jgi:hypothetical protein
MDVQYIRQKYSLVVVLSVSVHIFRYRTYWGCGRSVEGVWWLSGDVVPQSGCGGSEGIWWLSGDVVPQSGCGGSEGIWWLSGDVVAQWGCGG